VQRDAVHRRRHAVLADAVVDIAAGIVTGRDAAHILGQRQVGMRQVGGAANRQIGRGVDNAKRHFRCLARRHLRRLLDMLLAERIERFRDGSGTCTGNLFFEGASLR
jgi:hypothetical protein